MPYDMDRDNYTSPPFCNHPAVTAKPTAYSLNGITLMGTTTTTTTTTTNRNMWNGNIGNLLHSYQLCFSEYKN
jgi:hypothetical protein